MSLVAKTDGVKEPDPIYPHGSTSAKYQNLTHRDLMNALFAKDTEIAMLKKELKAGKAQLRKAKYTKDTAIEMLRHETARHVETKMELEDTEGMSTQAKNQTRHQCMVNICRERAGDHYALFHHQGKDHHYYAVEDVAKYVYYTNQKSYRDFDAECQGFGDHQQWMISSEESIAELKKFLEDSRAGLTATVTMVEVSDNSDGDGDNNMSE